MKNDTKSGKKRKQTLTVFRCLHRPPRINVALRGKIS